MAKDYMKKKKYRFFKPRQKKLNRSMAGNSLLFFVMAICGVFMALPLVMIINNCLKPLDEIYHFHRRFSCGTLPWKTSRICSPL